jgi:hypothetical protein
MTRKKTGVAEELRRLATLTVSELGSKYSELFGEPARSRNRNHLLRRISWRIQANATGGLSDRAVTRIADLGDSLPDRWQEKATKKRHAERPRDPRLPPPGAVLCRAWGSREHEVAVLENGFQYEGELFDSLSTIASRIAGSRWNGFVFFGIDGDGR